MRIAITGGHLLAHRDEVERRRTLAVKRRRVRRHAVRRGQPSR
jgi:hypothetical protein